MAFENCSDGLQVVPASDLVVDERGQKSHVEASKPFVDYTPVEVLEQKKPATILGLRRHHFFLFLAILVFVVVTTVGASVGGVISVRNTKHSAEPGLATVTITATQSTESPSGAPNDPPAVPINIDIECPKIQEASDGTRYSCHQGQDVTPGSNVISSFKTYSLTQCIDQCISKNAELGNKRCKGVVVNKVVKGDVQNCWLKNVTGAMTTGAETVFLALAA